MNSDQRNDARVMWRLGLFALLLLAVVLLTPNAGSGHGRSFFAVASDSRWQDPWDWAAAWCSLKIVLLSFADVFFLLALCVFMMKWKAPPLAGWLLLLLIIGAFAGWLLGAYELIKAIL